MMAYEDQTEINSNADPLDALIYPYSGGRIGLATISGYSDRNQDFYEIAVKRHLSDQGVVSIDYRTSDRGSAIAGEHFEMVSGTLAWADGDKTPKIIKVPLLGEPGGTRANLDFGVVLENLQGNAMYDATRGRVVLKDTGIDANWSGNIIPADFRTVTAEGETHEISFERIGGSFGALTLTVGFLESSFVSPYVDSTFTTTVTWADGELGAKLVAMPISDLDSSDGNRRSSQIWVEVLDIQSEDGFAHYWDQPWAGFPGSFKNIFSVLVVDDDLCDREECSLYFNSGYFYAYDDDVDLTWWVYRRDFGSENTPIERTFSTSLDQEITLNWDANDVSPRAIAVTDRQQNTGALVGMDLTPSLFLVVFTRFNANLAVTDSDNDGVVDLLDLDADNDGTVDYLDVDADGDGLSNEEEILNNRGNWLDADSDNDGTSDADDQMPFDANETLDFDSDGIGNNADEDDDNDGAPDVDDAFPLNAAESLDTDGDGVGNNADADDDNDDVADSEDAFPLDATESADIDGDGIGDNADAFPTDSTESVDTDSDGVGNNADTDDDNDGVIDTEDAFPFDADTDGDGFNDSADAFPTDATESVDTDSDGVGNNADTDDDNDGIEDSNDAFPLDAAESLDPDNDGVGNNADAFPDDADESVDTDGDGIGNNADTDDDNDGYEDQTEINSNADPLDALIYPYSGGRIGLATISGYSDRNQDFYEIAVKRHLSDQGVVSIDYRTSDRGSAIAGEHFEMVSGTLAWADGDKTPKIIKVPLLGEPGGTRANLDFGVVLENLQGNAMYDATRGRVVLKDTGIDANWSGNIISADFRTVTAEGETHEISFERIGGSFGALTLTVGFLESSFVSPYVDSTFTTTVTWADGELGAKLVAMPISDLDSSDGNRRSSQIWVEVLDIQSEDGFAHYWDQPWAGFPGSFKNIFSVLVVDDDLCDREECSLYFNSGYFYAYDDDVDLTWWVYRRDFGSENTPIERTFSTSLGQEITLNWDAHDVSPRAVAVTDRQQNTGALWNGFDFTIFSGFTGLNANLAVTDSDNDGVVDLLDFDADNDGTVDYLDVDADGDGLSNEEEILNNRGNWLDADSDNDGTSDADDQMPFDANETLDFDSDGVGDNADEDDDNDGAPDVDDAFPLNAAESLDTDGDGVGNNADADDDNDDVADSEDAFPLDATESADIDGDSIGDNADEDNDNDGAPDVDDAFPLNAAESLDTDGDGVGNNADADDDNDDVADSEDAFPLDATESADIDGDGIGDNADAFPTDSTESVDTDSDGVGNNADICLNIANPDQLDTDSDGYGDVCDLYPVDQELWSMKIEDALAQIEDENLRACIESPDNSISPAGSSGIQVSEITQIHCNSVIASLSGLENFTSVNTLILDRLVCDDLGRCERPFPSALNLFSDLSPLAELTSLQRLTLFNAQIDDVSALSNLIEIGSLDLSLEFRAETSARITDISALAGMTNLADLRLGYHTVSDLSALPNESVFSYLDLTGNNVSDFSSVTMGSISQLFITGNPVADYGPFESTQFLVLGMRIENDLDRAFAAASNAFVFGLGNNNFVPDFAFLSEKFTNMFVCFSCGLDDPQALMSLKQAVDQNDSIAVLNVSRNGIRDLAPLAGVQLAAQSPPLMFQKSINVSKNALTSLEPLKSIEGLTSILLTITRCCAHMLTRSRVRVELLWRLLTA